jgi:nucleoside-diphosphate-sugar epimerase
VRKALVTGATGLIGSHIVERLLSDGWSVRALVRSPSSDLSALGVEATRGDVLDRDGFINAASGCDAIFHTAAAITTPGGWDVFRRLNIDGTANAIAAAESSHARLLQLSSVAVYGSSGRYSGPGQRTGEDKVFGPLPERAYYARSKRESEQLVLDAHAAGRIWATAVRPNVVYGPRDRQFVPRIAKLLRRGVVPLIGGGRSTFSVTHAANVADGAVRAAASDIAGGRAYNVANDYEVSVRRFFELAGDGLGRRMRFISIPLPVAKIAFKLVKSAARTFTGGRFNVISNASLGMLTEDNPFTSERARRELGWSPTVRPEQGVPEAFRWWLTHH